MIWSGLILGFAGSLHCIAMCSPLASLVASTRTIPSRILYNLGRIIPYVALGGMAGALGSFIHFSQIQFWAGISFGILIIVLGISGRSFRLPLITPLVAKATAKIKVMFSFYLAQKNSLSVFLLGMLNGFIPCGLTYVAASYCVLLPSAWNGMLFMIAFGLGTFPAMIGSPWLVTKLAGYFSLSSKKLITIVIILLGCSVIARTALVKYTAPKNDNILFSICR
ncbi:MAG TPA: sulfite exporter TauE/SafE family protein [Cyclobacteriaceae bacterium]|jgi:sulfite exporter TauE/SafE|nr:sulfite exporter TauE/SafE family protein [Cyclobacteriaceae bacterium]